MSQPSHDPLSATGRRHRKRVRLGSTATCFACGERNIESLSRQPRTIFEDHHILGKVHEPGLTVIVCRNCHGRLSARQLDDGVQLTPQPTVLERLVDVLRALASFLGGIAEIVLEWAMRASGLIDGLDQDYPDWRTKPWAV